MRHALSALLLPVVAPLPRPAIAGMAFLADDGRMPPGRRPLRRHAIGPIQAPRPPRVPLGRYIAQGAAMMLAMLLVFLLAGLRL